LFDMHRALGVVFDGAADFLAVVEFAFQDCQVGLEGKSALESLLQRAGRLLVLGKENEATGFAVEPGNEVELVYLQVFSCGANEAAPWAVLGGMADDPAWLV